MTQMSLISGRTCRKPPVIKDGDVTEISGGTELKVQCFRYYKREGPDRVRCVDGKWTELPACKREYSQWETKSSQLHVFM